MYVFCVEQVIIYQSATYVGSSKNLGGAVQKFKKCRGRSENAVSYRFKSENLP